MLLQEAEAVEAVEAVETVEAVEAVGEWGQWLCFAGVAALCDGGAVQCSQRQLCHRCVAAAEG